MRASIRARSGRGASVRSELRDPRCCAARLDVFRTLRAPIAQGGFNGAARHGDISDVGKKRRGKRRADTDDSGKKGRAKWAVRRSTRALGGGDRAEAEPITRAVLRP